MKHLHTGLLLAAMAMGPALAQTAQTTPVPATAGTAASKDQQKELKKQEDANKQQAKSAKAQRKALKQEDKAAKAASKANATPAPQE